MSSVPVSELSKDQQDELLCTYASLVLHDDGAEITPEALNNMIKAAGCAVEVYWPKLFCRMIGNVGVDELLKMGSGGGGGGGGGKGPAGGSGGAGAGAAAAEEKKVVEEESEEAWNCRCFCLLILLLFVLLLFKMSSVPVSELSKDQQDELLCTYASL
ncbi:unnamed protein product, partial [Polarella glacialis]